MSGKIAIVCGSFHQSEVQRMLEWATDEAIKSGLSVDEVVWVPGAMEVPLALDRLLSREDIEGAAVVPADAVAEPVTVVVKAHHAAIAVVAVLPSSRPRLAAVRAQLAIDQPAVFRRSVHVPRVASAHVPVAHRRDDGECRDEPWPIIVPISAKHERRRDGEHVQADPRESADVRGRQARRVSCCAACV